MAEIVKVYKQDVPGMRFIGKKYGDSDRVDGMFGAKWGEWFQNGWFGTLEKALEGKAVCEDGDAYIGLMRVNGAGVFEYYIGMFAPQSTVAPEGFECADFPEGSLGVCWVYGPEGEVYCNESRCAERLASEGFEISGEWCFERYACPRFTTPDEKGNITLDICFFVK